MRRIFRFFGCTVLAAMLLTGCKNEEILLDNDHPQFEKGKLSFVLPIGANRTVTYTPVAGEPDEYALHNIRVYWFGSNDKLYKQFGWGDGTTNGGMNNPEPTVDPLSLTSTGKETVVTITVGDYDEASKFFVVANVNGDTISMTSSSELKKVNATTTVNQFKKLLSDAIDASNGDLQLLGTPLPMSVSRTGVDCSNGYVYVEHPASVGIVNKVELKRRVARFDVRNTADYSNFEITRIAVSRAQTKVWLNDSAFNASDPYSSLTGSFTVVAGPRTNDPYAFNGPKGFGRGKDGIDDAFQPDSALYSEREHRTKAAFYMYPTHLDSINSQTEIVIEGIFKQTNTPKLYKLNIPTAGVDIEANKLYCINVLRDYHQQVKFDLEIMHWEFDENVDTIYSSQPLSQITDWGVITSSVKGNLGAIDDINNVKAPSFYYEFSTSITQPDTLKFTTKGTDVQLSLNPKEKHVTMVSFVPRAGTQYNASDMNILKHTEVISNTNLTYGAQYETEHKVVLPPTDAPIDVIMQIFNPVDANQIMKINLRSSNYAKTGYKPVKLTWTASSITYNLLWAPLNVGASFLPKAASNGSMSPAVANNSDLNRLAGNVFQWGRNVAFPAYAADGNGAIPSIAGPLDSISASKEDKFITTTDDWRTTRNDDLWKNVADQPTPAGWRIPTSTECTALLNASTRATYNGFRRFVTNASASNGGTLHGDSLYIPISGYRTYVDSKQNLVSTSPGDYWLTEASGPSEPTKSKTFFVAANNGTTDIVGGDYFRGYGFYVRAVCLYEQVPY
jgi:hypothetical protein